MLQHRDGRAVWRVDDYNQVQRHATSPGSKQAIAETLTDRQLYFN